MRHTRHRRVLSLCAASGLALGLVACGDGGGGGGGGEAPLDVTPRLHQLYVFRSPTNANNTVFALTLNANAGVASPAEFPEEQVHVIHVDLDADEESDLDLETTFGEESGGVQPVVVRLGAVTLAEGTTETNLPLLPEGMFRAGLFDDPHFADQVGLDDWLDGGSFPRAPGTAANAYGPDANCLGIVLEIPSSQFGPNTAIIHVWASTNVGGARIDRIGRPLVRDLLIQPVPRGPVNGFDPDHRPLYRATVDPGLDTFLFRDDMMDILQGFFGRTSADASALADIFLPEVLSFQLGNPNSYGVFIGGPPELGNGRRLRDDVVDITVTVLTNGNVTTDNVPDDNGTRVTDGNMGTVAAFPYLGAAN